jgi:archaeosine synthase beta-subunit
MDLQSPAFVHITPTRIEGRSGKRLMIILVTRGCSHALGPTGGCVFCGFWELTAKGSPVSGMDLIAQFEKGLRTFNLKNEGVTEIDIYNSGSFLNRMEIPSPVRDEIFARIDEMPDIRKVFIESRPEFIVTERETLQHLKKMLRDRILEVGVGLETKDDNLRESLNKGFTRAKFEEACAVLSKLGINLLAYVLLKPPGLTEGQAIRDAIDTMYYLDELSKKLKLPIKVALQPTFVPPNTPLEDLYFEGSFAPPALWSVLEVLRGTFTLSLEVEVALSDETLAGGRVAYNCEYCTNQVKKIIAHFNATGDRRDFATLKCPCKVKWKERVFDNQ